MPEIAAIPEICRILDNLGLLLRETRRQRGLSLREAAEHSGVSFNTLSRIERGRDCSLGSATAILLWLDQTEATDAR